MPSDYQNISKGDLIKELQALQQENQALKDLYNQDITQSKRTENELRESLELNTLFMKYSPIYAFIKVVSESESKVVMASENYLDMIGIPGSAMSGKNMYDLFPADFAEKMTADDWSVVSSQQVVYLEEELMGRNYTTIKFPILLDGKTMLAGYTIDITERKRAEAELKLKNEELNIINDQKDKLFSIISHDLRNPFNSILGFSQLLLDQVKEKEYNEIEKYANVINHSSLRAMDLLKNLIDWSQLQTGRIEFNPENFIVNDLLNYVLNLFSFITNQKSLRVSSSLSPELIVFADRNMIGTVLRNLISNAIKFTMPGGEITIFSCENQNGLTLSVSDTGVGIPENKLKMLFNTNKNISTTGTLNEHGTGFGLILCKEFIEMHKGEIWVESKEERGSIFSFTIPAIEKNT